MKIILWFSIFAFFGAFQIQCLPAPSFTENNLLNSLLIPQDATLSSVVISQCFSEYLPILSQLSNTFSTQYKACMTLSDQETTNLYSETSLNRSILNEQTAAICNAFQSCQSINDEVTFFNCYATVASEGVPQLDNIFKNASENAFTLGKSVQNIQVQRQQCQNMTEQTYLTNTAATYALLHNCLQNTSSANQTTSAGDFFAGDKQSISQSSSTCPNNTHGNNIQTQANNKTQVYCHCYRDTSIKIDIKDGGVQILNQTGCSCDIFGDSLQNQNQTSETSEIHCQYEGEINLLIRIFGSEISLQTQSTNAVSCSTSGSGEQNPSQNSPLHTMPTMAPFPPMPTMAAIPSMPTMAPLPPMSTMAPLPPMPTMAPFPPMPTMAPFN